VKRPQNGISWDQVHKRLRAADAALANATSPDTGRIARVFKERAARLARRESGHAVPRSITALVVRVGQERYAIEVGELAEVHSGCSISRVPGADKDLAGVTAIRGEIQPVWHLGRLLGGQSGSGSDAGPEPLSGAGQVLLLRTAAGNRGVLVDEIEDIREIDLAHCHAPSEGLRHVRAIATDSVIILDTIALFDEGFS
jgi:purine-binding chemotaxis protein CheW